MIGSQPRSNLTVCYYCVGVEWGEGLQAIEYFEFPTKVLGYTVKIFLPG